MLGVHNSYDIVTLGIAPRRLHLANGTARRAAVLPDWEAVLLSVTLLRGGVYRAIADRTGGDVVVAAALDISGRRDNSGSSQSSMTLGESE